MATDRYTKFILTIIAISLTGIASRTFMSPGPAAAPVDGSFDYRV